MKPEHYATRTAAVLAMCAQPRTLAEIREAFGEHGQRAEYVLHNLVKRGLVVNVRRDALRCQPGIYQAADAVGEPLQPREPVQRVVVDGMRAAPGRRWDATELVRAWSGVAG